MEATMKTPNTVSTDTTIKFIRMYRDMERLTYETAFALIRKMIGAKYGKSTIDHLCDQWKWKKKDFADWYLNLGTETQILVLNYFGITDPQDESYVSKVQAEAKAAIFLDAPATARAMHNTLIFFYNNGIGDYTFEKRGIPVNGLVFPETSKKQYGNGTNWGEFILSNHLLNPESVVPVLQFAMTYR